MRHRLSKSGSVQGPFACAPPIMHSVAVELRCVEMMREHLGFTASSLEIAALEHAGNLRMQGLALALQQGIISCILNQRMFEDVCRERRCAASEDELGRNELVERLV